MLSIYPLRINQRYIAITTWSLHPTIHLSSNQKQSRMPLFSSVRESNMVSISCHKPTKRRKKKQESIIQRTRATERPMYIAMQSIYTACLTDDRWPIIPPEPFDHFIYSQFAQPTIDNNIQCLLIQPTNVHMTFAHCDENYITTIRYSMFVLFRVLYMFGVQPSEMFPCRPRKISMSLGIFWGLCILWFCCCLIVVGCFLAQLCSATRY